MTKLTCNANDCMNNKDNCCCMDCLSVGGCDADCKNETCCEFYKPKKDGDVYTMGFVYPNPTIDLDCSAEMCRYNDHQKCVADQVSIVRHNKTTNCNTFEEK